jgi:hypothetical protein
MVAVTQSFDYFGGHTPYLESTSHSVGHARGNSGRGNAGPASPLDIVVLANLSLCFVAVWFPNLSFTADWPVLASEVLLFILIVQGLRRRSARDRMIAAAFLFYWFVRLTLTTSFGAPDRPEGNTPLSAAGTGSTPSAR